MIMTLCTTYRQSQNCRANNTQRIGNRLISIHERVIRLCNVGRHSQQSSCGQQISVLGVVAIRYSLDQFISSQLFR